MNTKAHLFLLAIAFTALAAKSANALEVTIITPTGGSIEAHICGEIISVQPCTEVSA